MRFGFFFREALRALKRNAVPSFAAMATVLVTVLILGVFIPMVQATTGAANEVRNKVIADVYLKTNVKQADIDRVREVLLETQTPHVKQGRVRLQGAGASPASARPAAAPTTTCWAPTRSRTPSASRPTSRTTSARCATRSRRSPPAAGAR